MPFRLFLSLALLALLPAAAPAAANTQLAQSVPVWEPGDPVPDAGPDLGTGESLPWDDAPDFAPKAAPAPVPKTRPADEESAVQAEPRADAEAEPQTGGEAGDDAAALDPQDFLCGRAPAGKTVPVPAPFDRWLVRVCSEKGQALVPHVTEAWVAHGSADAVSILALPPGGAPPPGGGAFDPRYDIRFVELVGGRMTGERLKRASALIEAATAADATPPPHDEVWQLDAVSNIEGTRYNIFFYIDGAAAEGARPAHLIACLDQCRQALYLDVLKGEEAVDVLDR